MDKPTKLDQAYGAYYVNLSSVSSLACLLYDIVLTTDQEVQLIWPQPWTYSKILYFFLRYFSACVQITLLALLLPPLPLTSPLGPPRFTPHACRIWQTYQPIATLFLTIAIDIVLFVRVMAIYESSILRVALGICWAAEVVAMCVSLALTVPGIQFNEICLVTQIPGPILIYGIATISFQALLLLLTLLPFFKSLCRGWGHVPIERLLVRDGTWGFCLVFVILTGQAGLLWLRNRAESGILFTWILSVYSFVGYRILLNLRQFSPEHEEKTELATGTALEMGRVDGTRTEEVVRSSGEEGDVREEVRSSGHIP